MTNDELLITLKAVSNILQELINKLEGPPTLEVVVSENVGSKTTVGG